MWKKTRIFLSWSFSFQQNVKTHFVPSSCSLINKFQKTSKRNPQLRKKRDKMGVQWMDLLISTYILYFPPDARISEQKKNISNIMVPFSLPGILWERSWPEILFYNIEVYLIILPHSASVSFLFLMKMSDVSERSRKWFACCKFRFVLFLIPCSIVLILKLKAILRKNVPLNFRSGLHCAAVSIIQSYGTL